LPGVPTKTKRKEVEMIVIYIALGLALLAVFLGWYQDRTRAQGEKWLRDEGYLEQTPEEARQAQAERLYGKFRRGE
jgi:DNA-binding transcriptional regulator of glucitol operon